MINDEDNFDDEGCFASLLISTCCGAFSLGDIQEDADGHLFGTCSECKHQTNFVQEAEEDKHI